MSVGYYNIADDRSTGDSIGAVVETWVQWVLGAVGAGIVAGVAGVWALLRDRKEDHAKELAAAKAAGEAEVLRVKALADEKARERQDLANSFKGVTDQLTNISTSIHELREELTGQIGDVRHQVDQLRVRLATLEADVERNREVLERKRGQLNSLIQALQIKGIVTSFDPNSSTGLVSLPKGKLS